MSQETYMHKDNTKVEKTINFPCPSCGADMVFDPASQSLSCGYCSKKVEIENLEGDIEEYDFESAEDERENQTWENEVRVIKCESCGAQTVLEANITSRFCAFCGSPHIVSNNESAGMPPESLVPFKIDRKDALQQFRKWIKKRFFAPNALKKEYHIDKMTGVYIPHWTYDAETSSAYTGEGGTYYYVTETHWVTRNGKRVMETKQVRKIRWWPTSGIYSCFYDDVLVNASGKADERIMEKLRPYHLEELVHYKPQYLSGFLAERYSIGLKEGWEKAKNRIKDWIYKGVVDQINADEVRNIRISTNYRNIKYKHLLLPLWVSAYTYKNKVYNYFVNGQTGEVQGSAPVSFWKVAAVVASSLAAITAIVLVVSHMQGYR